MKRLRLFWLVLLVGLILYTILKRTNDSELQESKSALQKQLDETYQDTSTIVSVEEIATIDTSDNTIYDNTMVEKPPLFMGKTMEESFFGHIKININYYHKNHPLSSQVIFDFGKVTILFIVEKNGSISNVTVLNSTNPSFASRIVEIINDSPNWKPGTHQGKVVRVQYVINVEYDQTKNTLY